MELNTEINRVFGQEMAKLFAAEISDDELLKKARQVWADINNTGNSYWNKDSDLTKLIKSQYSSRMKEEVNKVMETPAFKDQMQMDAKIINRKSCFDWKIKVKTMFYLVFQSENKQSS